MERVSFKVAKSIKEAGYHEPSEYFYGDGYDEEDNPEHKFILCGASIPTFVQDWNNTDKFPIYESGDEKYWENVLSAPAYPDVWLWLWREKGCFIQVIEFKGPVFIPYIFMKNENTGCSHDIRAYDPEEAIIEAINYMVENDLIK